MSIKKYLQQSLGKQNYQKLPKELKAKIQRLEDLPPAAHPVTSKQLEKALS